MGALRKGVTVLDEVLSEPRNQMMFGMMPGAMLYTGGRLKDLLSMMKHGPDPTKWGRSFGLPLKGQSGPGTYFSTAENPKDALQEAYVWGRMANPAADDIAVASLKFPTKKIHRSEATFPLTADTVEGRNQMMQARTQHVLDQVGKGYPAVQIGHEVVIPNPNAVRTRHMRIEGVPEISDPNIKKLLDTLTDAYTRVQKTP